MDLSQRKEQFSHAYVRAIASVAGLRMSRPEVDDDSVDWCLAAKGGKGRFRSPKLDIQLKCTSAIEVHAESLRLELPIKNYKELIQADYMVPRVLVAVVVPEELDSWLWHSPDYLALRRCGFWVSLRGQPELKNERSVTVTISVAQQFTVEAVAALMQRAGDGVPI